MNICIELYIHFSLRGGGCISRRGGCEAGIYSIECVTGNPKLSLDVFSHIHFWIEAPQASQASHFLFSFLKLIDIQ